MCGDSILPLRLPLSAAAIAGQLSLPMPTAEHIDLLKGRYPATAAEFEAAWDTLWPGDATP